MNILVTGAKGFIGQNLMRMPVELGGDHTFWFMTTRLVGRLEGRRGNVNCDIANANQVRGLMEWLQPEIVIHLAARSVVAESQDDPTSISSVNVQGTHNLLHYAPRGCRFVFASSATVYGGGEKGMLSRRAFRENDPPRPSSAYAATKAAGEHLVHAYTEMGRVSGISLRLVAQVGQYSTHGLIHDIVRKLRSESECLELIGEAPGSQKPFMYVRDTVLALLYFALHNTQTEPLNISTEDSITVEEIAVLCMKSLNIQKPIKWLGWNANWAGDNPRILVCPYRAEKAGYQPLFKNSYDAVEAGLEDIVNVK